MLVVLVWVGFNQGIAWMTFSASPAELRELLPSAHIPDGEIDLLLNWGPIMYLIAVWPFLARMSSRGPDAVYGCVSGAGALVLLGCGLRMAAFIEGAPVPHLWLHCGQILIGLAGPVSASIAPPFAAAWFPASERTLATALIWTCQSAAPSLGFAIALPTTTGAGLMTIMFGQLASALGALALWLFAVPKLPRCPPSSSAAAQREACVSAGGAVGEPLVASAPLFEASLTALRRNRFWVLAIAGGASVGAFQCWSASLGVLFEHSPFPEISDASMGKLLGLVSNGCAFLGTLVAAPLAERYFHQRYKLLLVLILLLEALLLGVFSAAVPGREGDAALPIGAKSALVVLSLASVLNGLTAPVAFELGAEVTFPCSESVSSSFLSFTLNAGGFALTAVLSAAGSALTGAISCAMMAGLVALCMVMLLLVSEAYPRLSLDTQLPTEQSGCAECTT